MRKTKVGNFVAGVLTAKKDKDGNLQKCKARWVLKGFQDEQKNTQQTDSPAASRAGFRCATRLAANYGWDLYHMDLKTAFLPRWSLWWNRWHYFPDTARIYPPYIGARLNKPGYGLNDAPRRWWQIIDKALLDCGPIPTRADRCTYVLYDNSSKTKTYQPPRTNSLFMKKLLEFPDSVHVLARNLPPLKASLESPLHCHVEQTDWNRKLKLPSWKHVFVSKQWHPWIHPPWSWFNCKTVVFWVLRFETPPLSNHHLPMI